MNRRFAPSVLFACAVAAAAAGAACSAGDAQAEAARQQYDAAKNAAAQRYQMLQAARARVALARKAVADTVVRAPFTGTVAQRLVTTGDYVNKGTKVAVVVRVNPLRVQLTVP